jgi:hypothetical protein
MLNSFYGSCAMAGTETTMSMCEIDRLKRLRPLTTAT